MNKEDIKIGNEKIANFLGWYQDESESINLYFQKTDTTKKCVFDILSSPTHDLPFHRDWHYIFRAVEKIENMGFSVTTTNNNHDGEIMLEKVDIGYEMDSDFYTQISGQINEPNRGVRSFRIERVDFGNRLEALWKTIVTFLNYYQDDSVRYVTITINQYFE